MCGGPISNGNKILGLSSGQITAMGEVPVGHFQKLNESGGPKVKDSLVVRRALSTGIKNTQKVFNGVTREFNFYLRADAR